MHVIKDGWGWCETWGRRKFVDTHHVMTLEKIILTKNGKGSDIRIEWYHHASFHCETPTMCQSVCIKTPHTQEIYFFVNFLIWRRQNLFSHKLSMFSMHESDEKHKINYHIIIAVVFFASSGCSRECYHFTWKHDFVINSEVWN